MKQKELIEAREYRGGLLLALRRQFPDGFTLVDMPTNEVVRMLPDGVGHRDRPLLAHYGGSEVREVDDEATAGRFFDELEACLDDGGKPS